MKCYKCGAQVPDDAKYCTYCGADLVIDQKANASSPFGDNNNKIFTEEQNSNQSYYQNTDQTYNNGYQTTNNSGRQEPYLAGNDKVVIALLCFFLGGFGVHCFVMGETRKGIMRIVFSCLCGIGAIFALVDFIMILTDTYVVNPEAYFFK